MLERNTITILLAFAVIGSDGARILCIFPMASQSHHNVYVRFVAELSNRGHSLTVLTGLPFVAQANKTNYKEVVLSEQISEWLKSRVQYFVPSTKNPILFSLSILDVYDIGTTICEHSLKDPKVQYFIESKDVQFDIIVLESFFVECFAAFSYKFKAPLVMFSTHSSNIRDDSYVGNPRHPSFIPDFAIGYSDSMTFLERFMNTLFHFKIYIVDIFYHLPKQQALVNKYFIYPGSEHMPPLKNILLNTSLMLLNSHFSMGTTRPLVPNIIEVGGIHINEPKILPQNLQSLMDMSRHGVIYFSFGSVVPMSKISDSIINAFISAFKRFPHDVLWKSDIPLTGLSANVRLEKWVPQHDILRHPKCLVFITHGGLLSQHETADAGVPIVGIPFFGDQPMNVARYVAEGVGIKLELKNISEESVTEALKNVIYDPKYRRNAKDLSSVFRDRPMRALNTAIYWTEYIIRHHGAPQLRTAATHLNFIQYFLIDVIVVLVLTVIVIVFIICTVLKILTKLISTIKKSIKVKKQ